MAVTTEAVQTSSTVVDESDESEDESGDKILETGGGGRWQKNNHKVPRDVPGIDDAYLAMDTEEGVEVVWNEVIYSRKGAHKESKEQLKRILQGLTNMKHQNIVNFYDFWHDKVENQDRLVFMTEYITSGSLLQFLKKTSRTKKINSVSEKIWRRWCRQILSALSYLHKNEIIHGNLSLGSIFIQHNGLVKIGSVSPDAIHQHVKTKNVHTMTFHYKAPEYGSSTTIQTSADIYAFGMCALEMLDLELIVSNGEGSALKGTVHNLKQSRTDKAFKNMDKMKMEFIRLCLQEEPSRRPTAHELLKHPVLQEVFNLKYLCTFALREVIENVQTYLDEIYRDDDQTVLAHVLKGGKRSEVKASSCEKINIEKFCDEINQDFLLQETAQIPINSPRKKDETGNGLAPQSASSATDRNSSSFYDPESRRVAKVLSVRIKEDNDNKLTLCVKLQFEDKMERELRSELKKADSGGELAMDLVSCGLLAEGDRDQLTQTIDEQLKQVTWATE